MYTCICWCYSTCISLGVYMQCVYGSVCHCTTNNRCASLHIHSQSGGAGECVEEEGVVVQHSLHAEGLVEQQVGTVEGQPLPSPNSLPTDHMVSMSMHVASHHHLSLTTYN